jgi:hypothetical protein
MELYIRGKEIKEESAILVNLYMGNRVVKTRCVVVQAETETNTIAHTVSILRVAWSCRGWINLYNSGIQKFYSI